MKKKFFLNIHINNILIYLLFIHLIIFNWRNVTWRNETFLIRHFLSFGKIPNSHLILFIKIIY